MSMRYCFSISQDQLHLLGPLSDHSHSGFEIRLDTFSAVPDWKAIRAATSRPLLATYRTTEHLGQGSKAERESKGWLWRQKALGAGFNWIDLELDESQVAEKVESIHAGGAKAVLSHHDLRGGDDLRSLLGTAQKSRADVVKIIAKGTGTTDFQKQRRYYKTTAGRSFIHFYMGQEFVASRILSLIYGAPFTFLAPDTNRPLAPGQVSIDQVNQLFQPLSVSQQQLKLFAVIGTPIGHSRSPDFHNPLLKKQDAGSLFLPLPAKSKQDLKTLRATFPELLGLAVTKPMKELAAATASEFPNRITRSLGAANTLLFGAQTKAHNTDLTAMIQILRRQSPQGPVRILGFGGLGKAVLAACQELNLEAEVCNRTPGRVPPLSGRLREIPWKDRHLPGPVGIVQATSLGMAPTETESPLACFPESARWLIETIYHPPKTKLVEMASAKNLKVIEGSVLFQTQAEIQNQLFSQHLAAVKRHPGENPM